MELLGPSLQNIINLTAHDSQISLQCCYMIFLRTLKVLSRLHSKNIIHRNVNLDNICVGRGKNNIHKVYLIDFAHAEEYKDSDGTHQAFKAGA